MDRMKTFALYALCVIAFFIVSNVLINIAIHTSCKPIYAYMLMDEDSDIKVEITESQASSVNGFVGGKVINKTKNAINKKYIQIDLYSKRNILLGTKYVEISDVKINETIDFRMGFKLDNVNYCKVSVVDEVASDVTQEQFVSDNTSAIILITAVIFLCYF